MITKEDLELYEQLHKKGVSIYKLHIIDEVLCRDVDDENILQVAFIVSECYLKDDSGCINVGDIVDAVVDNWDEIQELDLSPREILIKYL